MRSKFLAGAVGLFAVFAVLLPSTASAGLEGPMDLEVKVIKNGSGEGRVSSDMAGIDCGTRCTGSMPPNFRFDMQADPAAGSVVSNWKVEECPERGGCQERQQDCRAVQRCLVEVNLNPIRVTVTFDKKKTSAGLGPKAGCLATWDENGSAKLRLATEPRRCDFHIKDGRRPIKRRSVVATAGVKWSKWGKNSATGKGKVHMAGIGLQAAKIWLTRPREVCGNTVYTRLQYKLDQAGGRSSKVKIAGCKR